MKTLYVVATPIGNLNDFSKRAIEVLNAVDFILCEDTRHSLKLLNHFEIRKSLISYHKFNEKERISKVLSLLEEHDVALISDAGTPCINDPGYILIKELRNRGINVIPIPGACAFVSALSAGGISSDVFSFYGFFPREKKYQKELITKIKIANIETVIFYESPKRIIKTLNYINESFDECLVSIFKDITKMFEKNYYGTIDKVLKEMEADENSGLGEYTIILNWKEEDKEEVDEKSIESMLVDIMVKNNVSLKEAINVLNESLKKSKKEIYNASLKLKDLL
jgi:16S rRNA (cytidine1402-2'-O)-methyltransferase